MASPGLAQKPSSAAPPYVRLERRLSLLAWLHHQLGYASTEDLLGDIKDSDEGFREDGPSYICLRLETRSNRMQGRLSVLDLQRYDNNIRKHLASMNDGRAEPITLRYFQYLAALYTEIYLDWRFNRTEGLLSSLNAFVDQHNANCAPDQRWDPFSREDLSKLAFWMATGGGKTLLLHLHYRQFCALQPGAAGQHPPDHAGRGPEPAAPGRAAGFQHPRLPL